MIIDKKRIKGLQAYKVKGKKEYLYVWLSEYKITKQDIFYEGYCTTFENEELPNCHTAVTDNYLRESCTPLSFKKLPSHVQTHLRNYIKE